MSPIATTRAFPTSCCARIIPFPQLLKHRGAKTVKGVYFGPFASAGAVNRTLNTLQRAFLLRSCSDSVFDSAHPPCLLFQIKRCSAPCVNRIDLAGYHELVEEAEAFLNGKSQAVQEDLKAEMTKASEAMDFEAAAKLRDRLKAMSHIQSSQGVNPSTFAEADLFAAAQRRRPHLHPGLLLPRRAELGQPALFPAPCRRPAAGRSAGKLCRPVL